MCLHVLQVMCCHKPYIFMCHMSCVVADGSSRVSLELPCLSLAVISQMLGPNMIAKASNGKKQLQVTHSSEGCATCIDDQETELLRSQIAALSVSRLSTCRSSRLPIAYLRHC